MAPDNVVEILMRMAVDKGSFAQARTQAEAALAALEKEGIKFNEKAGRYTLAGQFVSSTDVKKIYESEILPAQQKAAQVETQLSQEAQTRLAQARAYSAEVDKQNALQLEQERIEIQQREVEKQRLVEQQKLNKEQNKQLGQDRSRTRMEGKGAAGLMIGGMIAQQVGTSLTSPVDAYIKYAGMADKTSREWLATQDQIAKSTVRIGQNMAAVLAPVDKVKASLLDAVSQSKLLSGIAGGVGSVLKTGGSAAATVGQFMFAGAALKNFEFLSRSADIAAGKTALQTTATVTNTAETITNTGAKIAEQQSSELVVEAKVQEAAASKAAGLKFAATMAGAGYCPGGRYWYW